MKEILDAIDNITYECPGFTYVMIEIAKGKTMQYELKVDAYDQKEDLFFCICLPFNTMKEGLKALNECVQKTISNYCEIDYL